MPNQFFSNYSLSSVESVLQKEFRVSAFFLTSSMASTDTYNPGFRNAVKYSLEIEEIIEIKNTNSASSRVTNSVISSIQKAGFLTLEISEEQNNKNQNFDFGRFSWKDQSRFWLEQNKSFRIIEMLRSKNLGDYTYMNYIEVGGLIISENKTHFNNLHLTDIA